MTDDPNFIPARPRPSDDEPVIVPKPRIAKQTIWLRATDDEAVQLKAALDAQSVRLQMAFAGSAWLNTGDDLHPLILGAVTQLFGAERAAQLLEPTD